MASPFTVFRKNQKVMIAVLGVMAMFAFVFLPPIMEYMGSRPVANPVVVKTSKYGNLQMSQVFHMVQQRQKVLAVLSDVMSSVGIPPAYARKQLEAVFGPVTEESVVTTWLLANRAEQMGMVITNETINRFLKEVTQDRVNQEGFVSAFKRSGFTAGQFFDAMRGELAALQFNNMFRISLAGVTPAERWGYFKRVKQMATIEAVPLDVANYTEKSSDPDDQELKDFFEKHKDSYPLPDSPEPGFREPQKIALEFFKADYEKFTSAGMVTEDEIKERYEKNKDRYNPPATKPESDKSEGAKPETKPAGDIQVPTKADETKKPDSPESKDAAEPKKPTDSSSLSRPSPFILTAMEEEKPADAANPASPTENPAAATPSGAPAAEQAATAEKPAETPATPAAQAAPSSQEKPAEAKDGLTNAVKERIRSEIAYEKIQKVLEGLREPMSRYAQQQQDYRIKSIQSTDKTTLGPPPTPPDFQKLAQENGLSAGRTESIAQWEVQGLGIGTALVGGREPVWRFAFESFSKFRPEMAIDMQGNVFLFWKVEESKERVPKLDDPGVRKNVVQAWKMIGARNAALQESKKLEAEARASGKSLQQTFADRPNLHVIVPPAFSWLTFGNVPLGSAPTAIRTSSVEGIDAPGDDFMQTVFGLDPAQVGVAMNGPQTVAYVIRLTEFSPSDEVLWAQFEVDDFSKYAPAAGSDRQKMFQAWLNEIKNAAGLEWVQKPDQVAPDTSEHGGE